MLTKSPLLSSDEAEFHPFFIEEQSSRRSNSEYFVLRFHCGDGGGTGSDESYSPLMGMVDQGHPKKNRMMSKPESRTLDRLYQESVLRQFEIQFAICSAVLGFGRSWVDSRTGRPWSVRNISPGIDTEANSCIQNVAAHGRIDVSVIYIKDE